MADVIIIGGGAAGLAAAIWAKRHRPNLQVLVLEAGDRVGKKVLVTGNGQCNITNKNLHLRAYHGADASFCAPILQKNNTPAFFASLGVEVVYTPGGKAYPRSYQASSVVDALRFGAEEAGVEVLCSQKVTSVQQTASGFTVTANGTYRAKAVLVACGSVAGGKLGSDSGYKLLKAFGHTLIEPKPAIVQVKTETEYVRQLKGVKVEAGVTLLCGGKSVRKEQGEVLFCDYGLSGPPVLQVSRFVGQGKPCHIVLDLCPDLPEEALTHRLMQRVEQLQKRTMLEFLSGFLNKRLGQVVLKYAGYGLSSPVSALTAADCTKIAAAVKSFTVSALGTTGFSNAQVAAGGIATAGFSQETLMSKKVPGLFAAGEVLDIDGDCGGYNLEWCWAAGRVAGIAAADYAGKGK